MKNLHWLLCTAALLFGLHGAYAQTAIDGKTNLIVNGNAETGPAAQDNRTAVPSIPGWTRGMGMANVIPYGLTGYVLLTDPAPPDHGFNYFASASSNNSTLVQTIDVSSAVPAISGGNVSYVASAYLGDTEYSGAPAQVTFAFQNANAQTFSTATLGPVSYPGAGMSLHQRVGLVPSGTSLVTVTLTLNGEAAGLLSATADSLSLVFASLGTNPGSVLGTNLVVNGGGEAGPNATLPAIALYVPGWATTNQASVAPYGGSNWIAISDPGPADRGTNVFLGGSGYLPAMYQDIDVSPAASLIDAGQVTYEIGAWLGGVSTYQPVAKVSFSQRRQAASAQKWS